MEIDIIEYLPEQYATLSNAALEKIREAQQRKDALTLAFEKKLAAEKQKMMDKGSFLSNIWVRLQAEMTGEYEAQVAIVRENLLFYLHYADNVHNGQLGGDTSNVPYTVDYSLTELERVAVVRDYYMSAYTDPELRFTAFKADEFARGYLGEAYPPLWHFLQEQM